MNRRGSSILLIPLLAALAFFYPVGTERNQSQQTVKNGAQQKKPKTAHPLLAQLKPEEADVVTEFLSKTGPGMVADFLGVPLGGELTPNDRRNPTHAQFLFATLPDPVDSGEPYAFDRFLSSLEAALFQNHYSLSRFYLPWQDCILGSGESNPGAKDDQGTEDERKVCLNDRLFEYRPGIIVFTRPGPSTSVLLLYLIGGTPTSGIQKVALHTALDEMAWFCGDRNTAHDLLGAKYEGLHSVLDSVRRVVNQPDCDTVNILGPSFSGSAQSLDFALSSWLASPRSGHLQSVNIVSGTAIAINPTTDFHNISHAHGGFAFRSMRAPSAISFAQLIQYLELAEPDDKKRKVALLSESGTVPGRAVQATARKETEEAKKIARNTDVTTIVFPLHISQLRAASEKHGESQPKQTPAAASQLHELPLTQSLEEVNERRDAPPPLSQLDLASNEQILANLLSTISRERFRYIGIQATDVRDTIFLVKEVHEHCPMTVLFLLSADLLYLHPEVNSSLRGSISVTSYPLVNSNILWSAPHNLQVRMQFPDQASEGIYNAVMAILGHEDQMLEYGMPFEGQASHAPIWINVIGRRQMWPLQVRDPGSENKYMYEMKSPLQVPQTKEGIQTWFSGLYPESTVILMTAIMGFCVVFSLPVLSRVFRSNEDTIAVTHSAPQGERPQNALRRRSSNLMQALLGWGWWDRALGPAMSEKHRRGGELYLLVACASLAAFLIVAVTAFFVPAIFARQLHAGFWISDGHLKGTRFWFATLSCVSCIVVVASMISLSACLRAGKARGFVGAPLKLGLKSCGPAVLACVTIIVLSTFLSASWISKLWGSKGDSLTAFFTSLRSLDLSSGVSALLPLLLMCMAGFVWAISSFHRVRMLEGLGSDRGFLCFAGLSFREIHTLEKGLRRFLQCSSFQLPASIAVMSLAGFSVLYLFGVQLVRSFESPFFYSLLGCAFFFVHLALWLGVLRFLRVWQETRRLLRHLFHTPIRIASKRYQGSFPALRKIDLEPRPHLWRRWPAPSIKPGHYYVAPRDWLRRELTPRGNFGFEWRWASLNLMQNERQSHYLHLFHSIRSVPP